MTSGEIRVTIPAATRADLWSRILDTFIAPSRLAIRLRESAPWLDVILIATAVAMLSVLGMPDEVFTESMREAVSRRGEPVEITSSPEEIARWGRAIGMLAILATHPMIAFVLAGLLTIVFSVVGGGTGTYREYLSISAHGLLIPAAGSLIALAIRIASAGLGTDGPIGGFFRPDDADSLLVATAAAVDPFLIWMLVVVAIGVAGIEGRLSPWRSGSILIGGYLLLIVATAYVVNPHLR